jgi:hypothetical protein
MQILTAKLQPYNQPVVWLEYILTGSYLFFFPSMYITHDDA